MVRRSPMLGPTAAALAALAALATLVVGLGACGDSDDPAAGGPTVDGRAYVAALTPALPPGAATEDDPRRVVFVVSLGEETLSLEDQVDVIAAFADTHDVRFVDHREAAIDEELPGHPPKDEGVLLGIGSIPGESPYIVRVETYATSDRITAELVTLRWQNESWTVGSTEEVVPEGLVEPG